VKRKFDSHDTKRNLIPSDEASNTHEALKEIDDIARSESDSIDHRDSEEEKINVLKEIEAFARQASISITQSHHRRLFDALTITHSFLVRHEDHDHTVFGTVAQRSV
jgi:hypothetical protein